MLQVPRFWLIGYDENRQPLTPEQVRVSTGCAAMVGSGSCCGSLGCGPPRLACPLTAALPSLQVLEDVSEEHARKTVTMEPHPHGGSGVQVRCPCVPPAWLAALGSDIWPADAWPAAGARGAPAHTWSQGARPGRGAEELPEVSVALARRPEPRSELTDTGRNMM